MRRLAALLAVSVMMCLVSVTLAAGDPGPSAEDLQEQIDELREQLNGLEAQLDAAEGTQKQADEKNVKGEKIKVSGYIKMRFVDEDHGDSTFGISRSRLKLKGHVTDLTKFTLQIDARSKDGKVDLRDAYIDRLGPDNTWYFRAGQAKVPIMYEVLESSSVRLSPERTAVARASFPGERDVGIVFHAAPERWRGASLALGIVNGQGRNASDANNHKDVLARLLGPVGSGTGYVGYYSGEYTTGGVTTDKTRLAVGAEQHFGHVAFRGEYVSGENLGLDMAGWYGQLACTPRNRPDTFFVRYDQYDEDRDVSDTTFKRTTVGWERKLDKKTRLTFAYESKSADSGFANVAADSHANDEDAFTAEMQVKY